MFHPIKLELMFQRATYLQLELLTNVHVIGNDRGDFFPSSFLLFSLAIFSHCWWIRDPDALIYSEH